MERLVEVLQVGPRGGGPARGHVAREFPLTIILNGEQLVTVLCSPSELEALAVGFLFSEGIIKGKGDVASLIVDDERGIVRVGTASDKTMEGRLFQKRVLTTGCGRGMAFYSYADLDRKKKVLSSLKVTARQVLDLSRRFQGHSELYRTTHGVHSAALCSAKEILVFAEDIGRHNAVDKVLGRCLLEERNLSELILVSSGRISSEIVFKAAGGGIPVVVSKSAPTDLGVEAARELGITLIGFVRGGSLNVYSGSERLELDGAAASLKEG